MKTHNVKTIVAAACLLLVGSVFADDDDVDYTTLATGTPGIWNSNFSTSLEYAKAHNIPVIMYYGVYGCTYAKKGAQALNVDALEKWFAEKQIIMIYKRVNTSLVNKIVKASNAAASEDPDLYLGRQWVRENSSVATYPIMRIYWNKADGTVISKTFTCRNGQMPVTIPAGSGVEDLAGQLLGTLERYFGSYVPGAVDPVTDPVIDPVVDPVVDPEDAQEGVIDAEEYKPTDIILGKEPSQDQKEEPKLELFGKKVLKYQACLIQDDYGLVGVLTATAAKASTKGTVKISGKVTDLYGDSISFSAQTTVENHAITKMLSIGKVELEFTDDEVIGFVGGSMVDPDAELGGLLPVSDATFYLTGEFPEADGKYAIVHEALPTAEPVVMSSKKLVTEKAGSVKWNSKDKKLVVSEINPSALKLTYSSSSGMFKGSFKVYEYMPKTNAKGETTGVQLKKVNASVTGFFVGGIGHGVAAIRGVGSYFVTIASGKQSEQEE